MPTTTIRLPEELKARVAAAAKRAGTTSHTYILQAIAERTEQDRQRVELEGVAEERYRRLLDSGRSVPWTEVRAYLKARAAGKAAKRPAARRLGR